MAEEIQVRTVRVELLRAGPAHNQLLSPLTPYLGVCDDAEAGIVTVPFEQHTFERRMRAMRHDDQADDAGNRPAQRDRLPELRDLGMAMGKLLGSVPRLPGALAGDPIGRDMLVRLSLTLAPSELAGLPFELAKVPIGPDACTENWLSLQSKVPVVITRRGRNVSTVNLRWLESPRILFVSADPDDDDVPFREHLAALLTAVRPFAVPDSDEKDKPLLRSEQGEMVAFDDEGIHQHKRLTYGAMLTVLPNASCQRVVEECARTPYTHVHILAHGEQDTELGDRSHGLRLHAADGVISGERLASALAGVVDGRLHRPQVVTLSTCDSGKVPDLVHPGASLAHTLHQAGIPLVVASQVPLSFEASTLFVQMFYPALMWGEHPWVLMHRIRSALHGRLKPVDHDWASLVVYECLPTDMSDALERARYQQCKVAMEVSLLRGDYDSAAQSQVMDVIDKLQDHGRLFGMEALALRADMRLGDANQASLHALHERDAGRIKADELTSQIHYARWSMEEALADYERAVDGFLVSPGQGLNAPFRSLLSQLSIRIAIGKPLDWGLWHMVRYWVDSTIGESEDPIDRSWALACRTELWLLRPLDPAATESPEECARLAEQAMREMAQNDNRKVRSNRVAEWWLQVRLECYANLWLREDFRSQAFADADPTEAGSRELRHVDEVTRTARKLLRRLERIMGIVAEEPAPAPAPDPEPEPPAPSPRKSRKPAQEAKLEAKSGTAKTRLLSAKPAAKAEAPTQAKAPTVSSVAKATPGAARATQAGLALSIEMLPVAQGDCLWVEWGRDGQRWRMLVDCGTEGSFKNALGPRIARQAADARRFELFILSHVDGDHIGGGIALLQQAKSLGVSFGDIWFNGREHLERRRMLSAKDGDDFSTLLRRENLPWNLWRQGEAIVRPDGKPLPTHELPGGMQLTLLSPVPDTLAQLAGQWDKELATPGKRRHLAARTLEMRDDLDAVVKNKFNADDSRPNGSSIAVLLQFAGKSVLLGADAYADVLASGIQQLLPAGQARLKLDAFKLPHHASRGNLHDGLMALVDCPHHLVSTSGAIFEHPDREALARVVRRSPQPVTLWFNHPPAKKNHAYHAVWQDPAFQQRWNFAARYPEPGHTGITIELF